MPQTPVDGEVLQGGASLQPGGEFGGQVLMLAAAEEPPYVVGTSARSDDITEQLSTANTD